MKWLWADVHTAHVDWVFWNPLLNLESAMHWINNRVANTKWLPDKGKYINIKINSRNGQFMIRSQDDRHVLVFDRK